MKTLTVLMIALLISPAAFARDKRVRGYRKKNGAVVQPYHRSEADSTVNNNYSTQGNVNPYTGKSGRKKLQ